MTKALGTRFVRADGLEKVTGQSRYTADLALPGMLTARFLYAGFPHARIKRIDTSRAEALSDVVVLTQEDVPSVRYGMVVRDRTLFARDAVRFEGEVVAAVAAPTAEAAEEACGLIEVEYEPLEPVVDPELALAEGAPLVHTEWEGYESLDGVVRHRNDCGYVTIAKGDLAGGLAEADEVVEERYVADMSHPVPIEPHAVVAEWQDRRATIWSTTQVPFTARAGVAETLAIPESEVRVIVPHLGGGFGGKSDFHFEAHVAALARKAGRPVRLVFTRGEEFVATDMVRHPMVIELTTGVRRDGTITARQARLLLDTGAYAAHGPVITEVATMMAAGPYRIPHLLIEGHTVYTNKTPAASTRAPSGPQVCWAVEQHTDVLAERVGMDPYQFRLKNLVEDGDEGPTGQRLEAVGVKECLREAAELIGWRRKRRKGEGIGLACGWWFTYPAPCGAHVRLNVDGTATLITGAQENGSGAVMGLAVLVAEELGLDPGQVLLLYQDTDVGPFDSGSAGSQTTFNNGRAVIAAAGELREHLLMLASEELEAAPEDFELSAGAVRVRGAPERAISLASLAVKAQGRGELLLAQASPAPPPLPESLGASACTGRIAFPAFAAPSFFCHGARVSVDHETGVVRVREVAAAHDFGRVLNPLGAEGQVEGGVVHALGMALTEGTQYEGGHQLNPHLLDYKLQTAADVPPVRLAFVECPAREGPHGAKGAGEPPVVPTAGAVANAIAAATGARVRRLPMYPYRVWSAMRGEEDE